MKNIDRCIVCDRTLESTEPALLVIKDHKSACMCTRCADGLESRQMAFREIHRRLNSIKQTPFRAACA